MPSAMRYCDSHSFPFLICSIVEDLPSQFSEALHVLQWATVPINLLSSPSFPILFCWPSKAINLNENVPRNFLLTPDSICFSFSIFLIRFNLRRFSLGV